MVKLSIRFIELEELSTKMGACAEINPMDVIPTKSDNVKDFNWLFLICFIMLHNLRKIF
jgi:hypothetical protein